MMKNIFYFILKAFFVLKIFKFLSQRFGQQKKWLDQKDKVDFKIYDVTTGKLAIAVHILSIISRRKRNQAMKFGQVIEDNKTNIFLQTLCIK